MALREGGLPMLAIAAAFRRLNRWRVNCGATYAWGGRAVSPDFGFIVGWITILAYVVGVVSISLPIGPYVVSLFGNSSSRPGEAVVGFVAVILATVIAYIGIKLTAWTQWVLIAVEYTGVGILAIWCLVAVFSHNPVLATVIIGVIAAAGVWLYTFGSSSVVDSFDTVVSVDGLLFTLYYALTGIATAVYYRKLASTSVWNVIHIAVFPLAAAGFLAYIVVRSVEGLGGWSGRDLVSLYIMLGIGVAIMLYVRFAGGSDYFSLPRETYQPVAELQPANPEP